MDERVLLVEDDPSIKDVVLHGLQQAGFKVVGESDGRQALLRFNQESFDVVVLDIMLPSLSGLEICREIRRDSNVSLIMLTAKTDTMDIVVGLEAGADDYVTKPFEIPELVARIRAVLRRTSDDFKETKVVVADLEVDPAAFKVSKKGVQLSLTATEFRLLIELARHPGQVMTREILLDRVWNYDYLGDSRIVDMAVKRLREKVEDDPSKPRLIQTVRGVGYRLERN
jgi:two-component system response regulator MtrA